MLKINFIFQLLFAVCLYSRTVFGAKSCRLNDIRPNGVDFVVPPECTKLALGGENLGDEGVVELSKALTKTTQSDGLKNLVEVHLPTTKMGPVGASALANFLTTTGSGSSLRILNVYGNELGDEGAVSLSAMFAGNNQANIPLETLGIGVNNIGGTGAKALATHLKDCTNCPLKTLGLYRNRVGDEGAVALAEMVAKNKLSLSALFLGGNFVKNEGAVALATALKTNTQLKVLSLEGGTIGDRGVLALADAITSSKSLTTMDIRSCLPTHRSCKAGHLSTEDFTDQSKRDPDQLTSEGLLALKRAVGARSMNKGVADVKIVGDINFVIDA